MVAIYKQIQQTQIINSRASQRARRSSGHEAGAHANCIRSRSDSGKGYMDRSAGTAAPAPAYARSQPIRRTHYSIDQNPRRIASDQCQPIKDIRAQQSAQSHTQHASAEKVASDAQTAATTTPSYPVELYRTAEPQCIGAVDQTRPYALDQRGGDVAARSVLEYQVSRRVSTNQADAGLYPNHQNRLHDFPFDQYRHRTLRQSMRRR